MNTLYFPFPKNITNEGIPLSLERENEVCKRGQIDLTKIMNIVTDIESDLLERGDECIIDLTEKFDGVRLSSLHISREELKNAASKVDETFKKAFTKACQNIEKFHTHSAPKNVEPIETSTGVKCSKRFTPIESVGIYIPGGTAPLFSTVMMLAIPAKIAGCKKVIMVTPPQKDGTISPIIAYAALATGVSEVYLMGGAQAVLALAHGTQTIPKVNKIFGPGNSFVMAAKMHVSAHTAIDMPAGPSEVLVIADHHADPEFIAADLLSQAEHGTDSQSVFLTTSTKLLQEVSDALKRQLKNLSRSEIAKKSIDNSYAIVFDTLEEAFAFSNTYAPEHLILNIQDHQKYYDLISNAGSVFCGPWSCESAGDYASGTNHTLPTSGFAKSFSGVSVESFGKWITFQELSQEGIKDLGKTIETLAYAEGLDAHAHASEIRHPLS